MKEALNYTIRPCKTTGDFAACVALQRVIWGYAENEVYPLRLFVTITNIGGHVIGAFTRRKELVGFVASMPAWRGQRRYYQSLSLGVLPAHENRGLGRALKLRQRVEALSAGIRCIEWTFDPMRAKNALFNIERLGAVARRYLPNHYADVRSRLQQRLPSDRLLAEWWLDSPRVKRALARKPPRASGVRPPEQVTIPGDFARLVESHPVKARQLQSAVRRQLQKCFARKLTVTGFTRNGSRCNYILDRMTGRAGELKPRPT
jgi:predicted GNAT superfamily acetyltransferase